MKVKRKLIILKKIRQTLEIKGLTYLALIGMPVMTSLVMPNSQVIAQSSKRAVVFAPPSNVRSVPNGKILCSVRSTTSINVYGYNNGWYETDYCGWGYIHQSQVRLTQYSQTRQGSVICNVMGIQRGQLALRFTPNGESRAGLNNGNTVRFLQQQGIWAYVGVVNGYRPEINGLEGWVNSSYLTCYD